MSQSKLSATAMLAIAAVFGLVAAACGSDASTTSAETTDAPTETTTAAVDKTAEAEPPVESTDGSMEASATPTHIVSLSPSSTEILFAIGAGEQVVAVDSYSNFPAEAPITDLSGFEPSLEAIIAYEPDLVVLSYDPGEIVAGLEQAGVTTIVHPAATSFDDIYAQVAELGVATGQVDGAAELNASMQADLAAIVESVPADNGVRVYHELDQTFYSAASSSFLGQIYTMLGVTNVADQADADGDGFGYPQLSAEYILEADPNLIVITDQGGYGPDDVAARPGWDAIAAVRDGNVLMVSADEASRWGPRVVSFAQAIADQIALVPAG